MNYSNLNSYKDEFIVKFGQIMQEHLEEWKDVQRKQRRDLISFGAFIWYFVAFLFGFVPGKNEHPYDINVHIVIAIVFFITAIVINIHLCNKEYQNSVKSTLFSNLLKIFNSNIRYKTDTDFDDEFISKYNNLFKTEKFQSYFGAIQKEIFDQSKLFERFKYNANYKNDDDYFWGVYNDVIFQINELKIGYLDSFNDSESKRSKDAVFFKGVAMHFLMNKKINSRVIITSKGIGTLIPKNFEKVDLEYEKFTKKYNVWVEKLENSVDSTSGQIEARYLFNTVFMERFMELQTSFNVKKLQASIFGDSMLILLNTRKDLFEMNHLFGRIDDINQYKTLFNEFVSVLSFIDVLNLKSKTGL